MTLKYSFQIANKNAKAQSAKMSSKFNLKLAEYAKLLADQGCLLNAYNYINDLDDVNLIFILFDISIHLI